MIKHLYSRQKMCPSTVNDIDLTDAVKTYILDNRVYKIPKIPKKSKPETILSNEVRNYIYLIRPKENVENNQNIYKVGRTKNKELTANFSRLSGYGKGTELITITKCNDCDDLERKILDEFNNKFERHKFGNEYFIGSERQMCDIINDLTKKQYETLNIEEINNN